MSLHAQLSPEAQARLDAQRRNSTISSILVSILVIVLFGVILAFIFLPPILKETPPIISYQAPASDDQQLENKKMTNSVERKPSAPSSARSKVITAATTSNVAVPVPEIDVPDPSTDFGDGDDFGDGWGSGGDGGGGGGFGAIPASMRKRCSPEDRMQRLLANGGTERCEEVVVKGLDWLQETQNEDGSWDGSNKSAMTGLAILAYLGHCETPVSPKYGTTVLKGITWLVNLGMKQNGRLNTDPDNPMPYQHAIATYALGESATFAKQLGFNVPNLFEVTQKAGQYIIDNQNKSGGWEYGYREESARGGDLSVAAWQIQALKACKHTGLDFQGMSSCIRRALNYVEQREQGHGGFAYSGDTPAGDRTYFSLTGAGMLSLQMWDKGSAARKGAEYIRKNSKLIWNDDKWSDLYTHYYESQAMMNRGGDDWEFYNNMFRDEVLNAANPDGSFKPTADTGHSLNNVHYRTCLSILMLEVYYRFLPATGAGVR